MRTVLDFGARSGATGSVNFDAFSRARDANCLILEPGYYGFDRPFDPSLAGPNVEMVGFGGPRNCLMQPFGDHAVLETSLETRMVISGIGFDGTDAKVNVSQPLVYLHQGSITMLTDIRVQNSGWDGLVIGDGIGDYPSRITITRSVVQHNVGVGITMNANDWAIRDGCIEYNGGGLLAECGYWNGAISPDANPLVEKTRLEGNGFYAAQFLNGAPIVRNCYIYASDLIFASGCAKDAKQYENRYYSAKFLDRRSRWFW